MTTERSADNGVLIASSGDPQNGGYCDNAEVTRIPQTTYLTHRKISSCTIVIEAKIDIQNGHELSRTGQNRCISVSSGWSHWFLHSYFSRVAYLS